VKLYIAGPMSGYPDYNYPLFHLIDPDLRRAGYETLNPASNPPCESWDGYMRAAIRQVLAADGIALLPDWQASAGASLEVHIAHTLRVPALPWGEWLNQANGTPS
jgi:DNA-binding transcriptional LysR family regulator